MAKNDNKPGNKNSNAAKPQTAAPETAAPETAAPETAAPETAAPEVAAAVEAAPETAAPEAAAAVEAAPEAAEERPLANVPRAFKLKANDGTVHEIAAGTQRMAPWMIDHWYSKAHGVTLFEDK